MDYQKWADEYMETVNQVTRILERLKEQYKKHPRDENLKRKINYYYGVRRECLQIAALLKERNERMVHSNV